MPSSHYGSLGVQLQHSGGQKQKKKKERGRRRLNVSEENRKRLEKLARDAEKRQKQKESDAAADKVLLKVDFENAIAQLAILLHQEVDLEKKSKCCLKYQELPLHHLLRYSPIA